MESLDLIEKLGTLRGALDGVDEQVATMDPVIQEVFSSDIKGMVESQILSAALKEGDMAPDFCLPDTDGNMVSSVELRAKGPIVVVFFRGKWCGYCIETLRMIRHYAPHFKARGATVVGIAPQQVEYNAEFAKDIGVDFPILSDMGNEYAQACQIAFVLDDAAKPAFEFADLPGLNGDDSLVLPIPAAYVIESDRHVSYSFVEVDYTKRAEPVDILNALPNLKQKRKSLSQTIEYEVAKLRSSIPESDLRDLFDQFESCQDTSIASKALQVGDVASHFSLPSLDGGVVSSKVLLKKGPMVVAFHHGHRSPICMLVLKHLQKSHSRFESKGVSVVAISAETPEQLRKTRMNSTSSKLSLLSDPDCLVAGTYRATYNLENYVFGESGTLPIPSIFVIGSDGLIKFQYVDCDITRRVEPSVVLETIPTQQQTKFNVKRGPFSFALGKRLNPFSRLRKATRTAN